MHHVRVALERHVGRHAHAAVLGHAADVVASEVHEHHVLGALLLVALQLLGQPHVLFLVAPARPRAGDRMRLDATPFDAHQHLRRRADDGAAADAEEIHVGRRVHVAERAIDGERIGGERRLEALREHHLIDVAGGDVFLGRADHLLELGAADVRRHLERRAPSVGGAFDSARSRSRSTNSILAQAN